MLLLLLACTPSESLEVRWPSGESQELPLGADASGVVTVEQE